MKRRLSYDLLPLTLKHQDLKEIIVDWRPEFSKKFKALKCNKGAYKCGSFVLLRRFPLQHADEEVLSETVAFRLGMVQMISRIPGDASNYKYEVKLLRRKSDVDLIVFGFSSEPFVKHVYGEDIVGEVSNPLKLPNETIGYKAYNCLPFDYML